VPSDSSTASCNVVIAGQIGFLRNVALLFITLNTAKLHLDLRSLK